jgi:hypothetical protein
MLIPSLVWEPNGSGGNVEVIEDVDTCQLQQRRISEGIEEDDHHEQTRDTAGAALRQEVKELQEYASQLTNSAVLQICERRVVKQQDRDRSNQVFQRFCEVVEELRDELGVDGTTSPWPRWKAP